MNNEQPQENEHQPLIDAFLNSELNEEAVASTLGTPYSNVSPDMLLQSTSKLLKMSRGEEDEDVRDSLEFQKVYGAKDYIADRIAKDPGYVARNALWKITNKGTLKGTVPSAIFDKHIKSVFNDSGLNQIMDGINPLETYDLNHKITRMGPGGITSMDSVPDEARAVQNSYLGYIDPIRSPESQKIGVENYLAHNTRFSTDGSIWQQLYNPATKKEEWVPASLAARSNVAFPETMKSKDKVIPVLHGKDGLKYVDRSKVDYVVPHSTRMFSAITNNVPKFSGVKGMRLLMGSKMSIQALPLTTKESPLVANKMYDGSDANQLMGKLGFHTKADSYGIVEKVGKHEILVRDKKGKLNSYQLYHNFPNAKKTYTNSKPMVKKGDLVKKGQTLAVSNFNTDNGEGAFGLNMRVAYIPWKGYSVSGDSMLYWVDEKGVAHYKPIEDAPHSQYIKSLALSCKDKELKCIDVYGKSAHIADDDLVSIETMDGSIYKATDYHSFMTVNEKNEIVDIVPSDMVPGKTLLPVAKPVLHYTEQKKIELEGYGRGEGFSAELDRDFGWFLGMFVAEGCAVGNKAKAINIAIHPKETDLVDKLERIYKKYNMHSKRNGNNILSTRACLGRWLREYCGYLCTGKKIPAEVLSNKEIIEGFIDGYWCGDGTVTKELTASTRSEQLAKGICFLLGSLGIRATYRRYETRWQDEFRIKVFAYSYDKFPELSSVRKNDRLAVLKSKDRKWSYDRIPVPPAYKKAVEEVLGRRAVGDNGVVSRELLLPYIDELPEEITSLVKADIWWDVVKEVKTIPGTEGEIVYDMDMRPCDTFMIDGGLIVHNSHEDGMVISESAAKKLTSEHMYNVKYKQEKNTDVNKRKFVSIFPGKYTKDKLDNFDDNGIIKPGTVVDLDDPLILAVKHRIPSPGTMNRKLTTDGSVKWEHHTKGVVTDVAKTKDGYRIYTRTTAPSQVGDKLSGRHGNKGVISKILPDSEMPTDASGQPLEVLLNPVSITSRTNSAQLAEATLGKVAAKTGKKYTVEAFEDESMIDKAQRELAKHGMSDTETVTDPSTGRKIPNVFVGNSYIYKLQHMSENKQSARSLGGYTQDHQPGGDSKRLGSMEVSALVSHSVPKVLRDMKLIKGQTNDEYWRQLKTGRTPKAPKDIFIYDKFKAQLKAAGVNLFTNQEGENIFAMDNKDVGRLTAGREIKSGDTYDPKTLRPIPGGLFGEAATGGADGDKFGYIQLDEPVLNPIMEEPVKQILGLTTKQFDSIISGDTEYRGKRGGKALEEMLKNVNIDQETLVALTDIRSGAKSKKDKAVKKLRALRSLKDHNMRPEEFMLTKIPVLPPKYRPITVADDMNMVADVNFLYRDLINSRDDLREGKEELPEDMLRETRKSIYDNFKAVVGLADPGNRELQQKNVGGILKSVFGKGSPKKGQYQRRMIGGPQDIAGRGVITPNPNLKLNQVGVPVNMAWKIYEQFIISDMVRSGYKATDAVKAVASRSPRAMASLQKVMKERPVMTNRAPTMHKYSIMALEPVLTKGDNVQVSNFLLEPLNGDYDGDTVVLHVPVSQDAVDEARKKMSPRANLVGARNFNLLWKPNMDYVMGAHFATKEPKPGIPKVFNSQKDAILAYRKGEIDIDSPIRIKGM